LTKLKNLHPLRKKEKLRFKDLIRRDNSKLQNLDNKFRRVNKFILFTKKFAVSPESYGICSLNHR